MFSRDKDPRKKAKNKKMNNKKKPQKIVARRSHESELKEDYESISAVSLGSPEYKQDYNVRLAYAAGGMYKGIASKELVVKMGRSGLMGYFGTGGLSLNQIEDAIVHIKNELGPGQPYGMNLLSHPQRPETEEELVTLFLKHDIKCIEASAFMQITPALVKYRANGLTKDAEGEITKKNKVMAKISRPEVAAAFLSPAPDRIIKKLSEENKITNEQAKLLRRIPMADDLCVEADSGGHTDQGVASTLIPAMVGLRDNMMKNFCYRKKIRVGAAGGIGTPEAAAAAFILGADFILTGSINQCTVEAGTSDKVKDLLEQMSVQDTEYAPAGDMFEMGAKIQVLRKGLFFPSRANKLFDLYRHYNSLDEIDEKTRIQIQEKYFNRSFESVYQDVVKYFTEYDPRQIERANQNPKHKMALIFRWYFNYTTDLALKGNNERKVDYQIHCGPALGAFNQWVKGTTLERWRNRHVDLIAQKMMAETAVLLNLRFQRLMDRSKDCCVYAR